MIDIAPWNIGLLVLAWTLIHFVWQGFLVGGAYAIVHWALGPNRIHARYCTGLAAMTAFAFFPIMTFIGQMRLTDAAQKLQAETGIAYLPEILLDWRAALVADFSKDSADVSAWPWWVVACWLAGLTLMALKTLWHYRGARRLCVDMIESVPAWDAYLSGLKCAFGIKRPVKVVCSLLARTPCLVGWIVPVIVIPASAIVGLAPQQVQLVIAHELGHIRRWDYLTNLAQVLIETLLFYHPAVHWVSRQIRCDREECCDALVMRLGADPLEYAKTLAALEEMRFQGTSNLVPAASGGILLTRIRKILAMETQRLLPDRSLAALFALGLTCALGWYSSYSDRSHLDPIAQRSQDPFFALPDMDFQHTISAAGNLLAKLVESLNRARIQAPEEKNAAPKKDAPADSSTPLAAPPPLKMAVRPAPQKPVPLRFAPTNSIEKPQVAMPLPSLESNNRPIAAGRKPEHNVHAADSFGEVTLSFRVDRMGKAYDVNLLDSADKEIYLDAALKALKRRQFDKTFVSQRTYVQKFKIRLNPKADEQNAGCSKTLGSRICDPAKPAQNQMKIQYVQDALAFGK